MPCADSVCSTKSSLHSHSGATVISLIYKKIVSIYGHCFIPIAYGAENMGKTTASEVRVAAVGQQKGTIKENNRCTSTQNAVGWTAICV